MPGLAGDAGVLINVDLADGDCVAVLLGDLVDDGAHHPARTTPRRPEIDDEWGRRLRYLVVERRICEGLYFFRHVGSSLGGRVIPARLVGRLLEALEDTLEPLLHFVGDGRELLVAHHCR